jgi:hypothetical protein
MLPSAVKIVKSEHQIADALSRSTADGPVADNSLARLDDEPYEPSSSAPRSRRIFFGNRKKRKKFR